MRRRRQQQRQQQQQRDDDGNVVDSTVSEYDWVTLRTPVPRTLRVYGAAVALGIIYVTVFFAFAIYEVYHRQHHLMSFAPFGRGGWTAVVCVLFVFTLPAVAALDWEWWHIRKLLTVTKREVIYVPSRWRFTVATHANFAHLFFFVNVALLVCILVGNAQVFFGAFTVLVLTLGVLFLLTLFDTLWTIPLPAGVAAVAATASDGQ